MTNVNLKVLILPLLLCGAAAASADELTITPGLWETKTTRTNPMGGDPVTDTTTTCIRESSWDPRTPIKDLEGCEITRNELSGNTLDFAMSCTMQGAETEVTGRYQVAGDSGEGNMKMAMSFGTMSMEMSMQWLSQRIDDC